MNPILKRLGVQPEVQAFFHADELRFNYGDAQEVYDEGYHYVPTTSAIWMAGNTYAPNVVITSSAMEAIAWYALHYSKYRDPHAFAFVSVGNLVYQEQLNWLRQQFPKRKFNLIFGKHLLGVLTDIRVAAGLMGKQISLSWQKEKVRIDLDGRIAFLPDSACSLHSFEKAFGLYSGIRTRKCSPSTTYLMKLQNGR
jgi:hypothetical protein